MLITYLPFSPSPCQTGSRRQSVDESNKLEVPSVMPKMSLTAEKLDTIEAQQQQRRASMSGRRMSLVEAIPDWPSLKHAEKEVEVPTRTWCCDRDSVSWPPLATVSSYLLCTRKGLLTVTLVLLFFRCV